jgi:hypothetical protein
VKIPIGPVDIGDKDAVAKDFATARALLDGSLDEEDQSRRGEKKGHPFRGNRYTGGIKTTE